MYIEWTKNGNPIEPVLVPDDDGVIYHYKPRLTDGNKTLHLGRILVKYGELKKSSFLSLTLFEFFCILFSNNNWGETYNLF